MSKQYQLRIDILNMILRFIVIFTIVSMISLLFTNGQNYVWRSLILFQASIISFIIDKYAKYIWIYIVLHLALIALYYFLADDISLKIIYMIFLLTWVITQFALGLQKKAGNTSIVFVIFLLIMYSICRYNYPESEALGRFFFYLTLVYGLIYVVNMYFINLTDYLMKHKDITNIPIKQIKATNRIYIVIFVYLSFVSMMVFTKFPMDKIFKAIGQVIVKFLRFALSGLDIKPSVPEISEPIELNIYGQMMENQMIAVQKDDPFWALVRQIMMGILAAAFIVMVLIMLFLILINIYKLFYMKKLSEDESEKVESIAPFQSWASFLEGMNSARKKLFIRFGKSNNEKIRKLYHKAVLKGARPEQELKYDTPEQLSKYAVSSDKKLSDESKKDKEEDLTRLYEKARYSNNDCSRDEVQEVKDLIK